MPIDPQVIFIIFRKVSFNRIINKKNLFETYSGFFIGFLSKFRIIHFLSNFNPKENLVPGEWGLILKIFQKISTKNK